MTKTAGVSLADLDIRKANSTAVEFEYITPAGQATGLFFSILGSQSDLVTAAVNQMVNDRRRAQAAQDAALALDRRADNFTPVEDDITFGQRLSAVRLAGWRGIDDAFTPENALHLCKINPDIASWVLQKSNGMGFTSTVSPKA